MLTRKQSGFTLLELAMILLVVILLVQILTDYLGASRASVNDALAQKNLRHMSAAVEAYAGDQGGYPVSMTLLQGSNPPYIEEDYCLSTNAGFTYTCTMWAGGYSFVAAPLYLGTGGTTSYTITTGGVWVP